MIRPFRFSAAILLALVASVSAEDKKLKYPETRKTDQVDDYHGTKVADPYRWLEDDVRKSTEVAAWVESQNKVTQEYLATIPQRDAIKKHVARNSLRRMVGKRVDQNVRIHKYGAAGGKIGQSHGASSTSLSSERIR